MIIKDANATTQFKLLDAKLYVKRIRAHPSILAADSKTLNKGVLTCYNITKVELKSFIFSKRAQSLSIDNADLGTVPKRLFYNVEK
jgi:hypothetical protein